MNEQGVSEVLLSRLRSSISPDGFMSDSFMSDNVFVN